MKWRACIGIALLLAGTAIADEAPSKSQDPLLGLQDASPRKRLAAAWQCAQLKTPEAEAAWIAALADPKRPELHFEACARLAAFETLSAKAKTALIAARITQDRAVRLAIDVALRETQDEPGAVDLMSRTRAGEKYFGIAPAFKPAAGAPTTFDTPSLDGTIWAHHGAINILGEGRATFITLTRVESCLLACVAHVNHRIDRKRPAKGPGKERPWVTDWTLTTGLLTPVTNEWRGPSAGGRVQRRPDFKVGTVPVGLVRGRLAAPALVRTAKQNWKWTSPYNETTLRFDGPLVPGRSGKVRIRIKPRAGEDVEGVVGWRVESDKGEPYVKLDRSFEWEKGVAAVSPNAYLVDLTTGAAAALGRRFGASATYVYAGKL